MCKLLNKFDETNENILDLGRGSRHPRRDRVYDQYGHRVVDRSREQYAIISRNLSRGSNRSYSRDRDWYCDDYCDRGCCDSFNRGYSTDKSKPGVQPIQRTTFRPKPVQ